MKKSKFLNSLFFAQNVVNILTDYAKDLDEYFKDEKNRLNHKELYDKYLKLYDKLRSFLERYDGEL